MLLLYRQKEDANVTIFEKERIMSVIKRKNREKRLGLNVKIISTRILTYVLDSKRENTES